MYQTIYDVVEKRGRVKTGILLNGKDAGLKYLLEENSFFYPEGAERNKEAEEFLHKLRAGITSYNLNSQKKYNIDFSAGIIEYDEEIHTECSAIMQDADERMYEIKKGKR